MLCKLVTPSNGSAHSWAECSIEVYQPPQTEYVFRLHQEGVSYDRPAFSPDGRWLAYVEDRKEPTQGEGQARVHVVSTDWQTDRPVTDWFGTHPLAWIRHLSWSADGLWLAFQHYDQQRATMVTYIASLDAGEVRLVGEDIYELAWSPQDPSRLAFSTYTGELYVASIGDLEHPQKVDFGAAPASLSWRPDGAQLAVCAGAIWLVDVASMSAKEVYHASACREILWSSDGSWLADYGGPSFESNDVIFHRADKWNITEVRRSQPILSANWVGGGFLLGEEEINPGFVRERIYQLTAMSPQDQERYVLWISKDVGLPEKWGSKIGVYGIAWYVPVQP